MITFPAAVRFFSPKAGAFAAILMASLALASCWPSSNRYRITATVDVDGVKYSGSTVQKLTCHRGWTWAQSLDVSRCQVSGAAVAVNVGGRGYLFVLRDGWDLDPDTGQRYGLQMSTYVTAIFAAAGVEPYGAQSRFPNSWQVDGHHLPVMAVFSNINDPTTLKAVEPGDISAAFGQGAHFDALKVSKTWEPITSGKHEDILPWIKDKRNYFKGNGAINFSDLSTVVDASSF